MIRWVFAVFGATCASSAIAEKVNLPVIMDGEHCEVGAPDDRSTVEKWLQSQPRKRLKRMEIIIIANTETPYKCVGAAIYALQRGGARRVSFIAEPPPAD